MRFARTAMGIAAVGLFLATGAATSTAVAAEETAARQEAAVRCGYYEFSSGASRFAAYYHCGSTTVRIHIDNQGGGSGNDKHLCVGPGYTPLGAAGNVVNAYYIGGAGCRKGAVGSHVPH
ncbi:DUF6355 family natural product biosynthesis protein [Allokutzneria sp. NRRL B-24872]|uniref:DUF6355 family natural product biosynthesis protein n=1 Tax=Allokutzneria sp. NRRL B-24872 TaxID=1137961 RepID=UPI001177D5A6|nr:DUF6355 family natural product biosynthesis protein [Allokutzneria sp. NRRL B-24872]